MATQIPKYTGTIPNRATDTPKEFADNVYAYQVYLNDALLKADTAISECIGYVNATESYKNYALKYRNDAQNSASGAASDRSRAENAANRAEAVVIPSEATYSLEDLENALNNLLTYQVAQAAQISILKQGA